MATRGKKRKAKGDDGVMTTLIELPQTLFEILAEIAEKENSQPHVVAHYVIGNQIKFELCPACAKGGTEKIVIRIEGPCSDSLVLKSLFGEDNDRLKTIH